MILSLMGLSEESQVAYLQKELLELDRRAAKIMLPPLMIGAILTGFYLVSVFTGGPLPFLVAEVGVPLLTLGIIATIYYHSQIKRTYRELKTKFPYAVPLCSQCKKTLSKEKPDFCAFCGKNTQPFGYRPNRSNAWE
jgi:hypothetical protein